MEPQATSSQDLACPLCGSQASNNAGSCDRKRQLRLQVRAVESGSTRISGLRSQLQQMCAPCQLLMSGITSEDDRLELRDRIAKELEPVAAEPSHVTAAPGEAGAGVKREHEHLGSGRDPEERLAFGDHETREKMLDKTLADSFPTSDPPSSIPDPSDDSMAA